MNIPFTYTRKRQPIMCAFHESGMIYNPGYKLHTPLPIKLSVYYSTRVNGWYVLDSISGIALSGISRTIGEAMQDIGDRITRVYHNDVCAFLTDVEKQRAKIQTSLAHITNIDKGGLRR